MAAISAKVLVKAKGLNNFPSAPIMVKTGTKLTMVVKTAVIMAPDTSVVALYTISLIDCFGAVTALLPVTVGTVASCSSKCRIMFSERMTPTSTMVPMAMAIPDKATILASTLKKNMAIKTMSTATGSKPAISKEALRLKTMTTMTKMVIKISKLRASFRVPKVSSIKIVLS